MDTNWEQNLSLNGLKMNQTSDSIASRATSCQPTYRVLPNLLEQGKGSSLPQLSVSNVPLVAGAPESLKTRCIIGASRKEKKRTKKKTEEAELRAEVKPAKEKRKRSRKIEI